MYSHSLSFGSRCSVTKSGGDRPQARGFSELGLLNFSDLVQILLTTISPVPFDYTTMYDTSLSNIVHTLMVLGLRSKFEIDKKTFHHSE
jgi:hypothetical protein